MREGVEQDSSPCTWTGRASHLPAGEDGKEQETIAAGRPADALSRIRDFTAGRVVLAHEGSLVESAILERYGIAPAGFVLDTQELAGLSCLYLRDHSLATLASSLLGTARSWKPG